MQADGSIGRFTSCAASIRRSTRSSSRRRGASSGSLRRRCEAAPSRRGRRSSSASGSAWPLPPRPDASGDGRRPARPSGRRPPRRAAVPRGEGPVRLSSPARRPPSRRGRSPRRSDRHRGLEAGRHRLGPGRVEREAMVGEVAAHPVPQEVDPLERREVGAPPDGEERAVVHRVDGEHLPETVRREEGVHAHVGALAQDQSAGRLEAGVGRRPDVLVGVVEEAAAVGEAGDSLRDVGSERVQDDDQVGRPSGSPP